MKLYFCSIDGNQREIFKSEELATEWQANNGSLAFINEITYEDKQIISVNGQDFNDFVESISDEIGSEEFLRVKSDLEKDWAFTEKTSD